MRRDLGLTLAGGGNRAFYQVGLLRRFHEEIEPRLGSVASCSAGACVAVLHFSGRADSAHEFWRKRRSHVTRNFDWSRLLRGRRPTPHARVYRDTVEFAMREGGLERLRALPFPIWVLTSRLPRRLPVGLALPLGLAAYNLEKRIAPERVHPKLSSMLGFRAAIYDARSCESPQEVADLILASSATPPFTPIGLHRGSRLLDGGLVDNAPAFINEEHAGLRRQLILLTRAYPERSLGLQGDRLYLSPNKPVPVGRWDYTRPDLLAHTIEQGEAEAAIHAPLLARLLAR
ncbi:MAG: patatin-like phospholipase family protein [Myxococcales bacterium]|nr:patatin-like phospholipase family protein [Myxococcales bacterium]